MNKGGRTTLSQYIYVLEPRLSIKTYLALIYILLNSINGKPISRLCTGQKLFKIKVLTKMIFFNSFIKNNKVEKTL